MLKFHQIYVGALVGSTEEAQFNTDLPNKIPVTTTSPLTKQSRLQSARAFATHGSAQPQAEVGQAPEPGSVESFVHKLV
jgi:hypothetical protein